MTQKADPGTERAKRTEKSNEAAAAKRQYLEDKRRLLEAEKDNYSKLMLVRTPDGWWKMAGHSAIIYRYYIAERLKIRPRLMNDKDYDVQSKEGIISFPDIKELERKLKRLKIYPINVRERGWVFDLGESISKETYNQMLEEESRILEMTNQLIAPEARFPDVNNKLRDLVQITWEILRKFDATAREAIGYEMAGKVIGLQSLATRVMRGTAEIDDFLTESISVCEDLYGNASTLLNLRLLEPKKILSFTETLVYYEKAVRREIKAQAAAKAAEEAEKKAKKKVKKKTATKKTGARRAVKKVAVKATEKETVKEEKLDGKKEN